MKVCRHYLGKHVEVVWRDPKWDRIVSRDRKDRNDIPKGVAALAQWREYGVIDDITEGIVRIVHSAGSDASRQAEFMGDDDFVITWVPEALIDKITVFEPVQPAQEATEG